MRAFCLHSYLHIEHDRESMTFAVSVFVCQSLWLFRSSDGSVYTVPESELVFGSGSW